MALQPPSNVTHDRALSQCYPFSDVVERSESCDEDEDVGNGSEEDEGFDSPKSEDNNNSTSEDDDSSQYEYRRMWLGTMSARKGLLQGWKGSGLGAERSLLWGEKFINQQKSY